MHRRAYLAAFAGITAAAGCLGVRGEYETVPADRNTLPGRYQYGYDGRNSGHASGLEGPTAEPALHCLYTEMRGHPLVADNGLYTATAAREIDGEARWDVQAPADDGSPYPALHDDAILSASRSQRRFRALDRETGEERWRTELTAVERDAPDGSTVATVPQGELTLLGDRVYFSTGIGIACVDLEEREEAWHTDLLKLYPTEGDPRLLTPAVTPEHVFVLNEHGYQDGPKRLYALDRESGEIDWTVEVGRETGRYAFQTPVVGDRHVLVTGKVTDAEENQALVAAVDPVDGELAWRERYQGWTGQSKASVADGTLYLAHGWDAVGEPGLLSAIDTVDGSTEWSAEIRTALAHTTITDDLVYVSDVQSWYALERGRGDPVWQLELADVLAASESVAHGGGTVFPPVVHDGRLYVSLGEAGIAGLE